jgi:hypothetical protein
VTGATAVGLGVEMLLIAGAAALDTRTLAALGSLVLLAGVVALSLLAHALRSRSGRASSAVRPRGSRTEASR